MENMEHQLLKNLKFGVQIKHRNNMAKSLLLSGSQVKVYIGGVLYPEVQNISVRVSRGETAIYGIDSSLPQEIAPTTCSVEGSVSGVYLRQSSGLQGKNAMTMLKDLLSQPYVSVEIRDITNDEKVLFIKQAKISDESFQISAKSAVKYSFNFKGIMPLTFADF